MNVRPWPGTNPKSVGAKIFLGVVLIFAVILSLKNCGRASTIVEIGGEQFTAEVVSTAAERNRGLSRRKHLAPQEAMLFVFPESARYDFWMKGMEFALDIIWLRAGKIVDMAPRVPPAATTDVTKIPRYSPRLPADRAVEVVAGTIDRLGLKIGDEVKIGP